MMEADRKLYADEVQNVVRKQKAQIEKLKRENGQLKGELQLQSRASQTGDGSAAAVKVTKLQDATDSITRTIELEKRKNDEIDMRTRAVREGILAERRDMGGNSAPQEQNQAIGKQIKVLEHRLHRALVKFNEAIAANKELREEIDNLRRERVVFDGIYKKLQHELSEKKKRMAEIIEVANVAYEARDRAQAEIGQLKLQAEREQQVWAAAIGWRDAPAYAPQPMRLSLCASAYAPQPMRLSLCVPVRACPGVNLLASMRWAAGNRRRPAVPGRVRLGRSSRPSGKTWAGSSRRTASGRISSRGSGRR